LYHLIFYGGERVVILRRELDEDIEPSLLFTTDYVATSSLEDMA
jgi:hypothetical protein